MKTHKVKWSISLNNGETYHEDKGNYKVIEGELSPWQRLLSYIKENGLNITSLSLHTEDGRSFMLPSAGSNPKFKAFADAPKPIQYKMFRKIGADVINGGQLTNQDLFTVAEAEYQDGQKAQIWVSDDGFKSWFLLI